MNDPSRIIEVEKSSLLSLKVEVLKKQEEIRKKKEENAPLIRKIGQSKKFKEVVKNNEQKKADKAKVFEVDDSSDLAKSRMMLEAKAKYYDRMTKQGTKDDPSSLVLFSQKKKESDKKDLVEYTDCFGRTRKIRKEELETVQQNYDEELNEIAEERMANEPFNQRLLDAPSQSTQEFFQKQKDEWRETEEINKNRSEIFYSNVLFDEARTHGVSYFAFSQDGEERKDQQEKLFKMREATEDAQQKRMALKSKRDEIMANRVLLAKKRRCEKLGIPFVEEEVQEKEESSKEVVAKKIEKDPEEELRKEMERRSHIREWDKNKAGSTKSSYSDHFEKSEEDWRPQRERHVMSQDEWVDKQRDSRKAEFAPVYSDEPKKSFKKFPTTSYKSMEDSIAAGLKFMKNKFADNK